MPYHLGFEPDALPTPAPTLAFLSGDPARAGEIARRELSDVTQLSDHRGLHAYLGLLDGVAVLSATSGMGAPSASIIANELVQIGIRTIIRVGTTGSIQPDLPAGSVVISSASLCRQGAADDIAPPEFPAAADPFVTVALAAAANELGVVHRVGVTASVDTFYEGQERSESSANPHLLRRLQGITEEYRHLGVLNYEMESGTLFKLGLVYGVAVGCVCAVVAHRTASELVDPVALQQAQLDAIRVAAGGARRLLIGAS